MRSTLALLALCFAAAASAADPGSEPSADPLALERLVRHDCGSCHGMTLKGGLGPDLRARTLAHYDATTLSGVILDGVDGTAMPPWRPLLSEAEAMWIAEYLLNGGSK